MTHLLIIDPQNDFCDPIGSLYVNGAEKDMQRLVDYVEVRGKDIDAIFVTLDSHHLMDIAHPLFWQDANGRAPQPFTVITNADLKAGAWKPALPEHAAWTLEYTKKLEQNGRYALCIWPPHCLIGSWGSTVYPPLFEALREWESLTRKAVTFVYKGTNQLTEHYSAFRADVPRRGDPSTALNRPLIAALKIADTVLIAGEAQSHCVRFSAQDLIDNIPAKERSKLLVLSDAMSPVTGFEAQGAEFLESLTSQGIRVATTESS